MADEADVEAALVLSIAAALYPAGAPGVDGVSSPTAGAVVRVSRGYPAAAQLEADLAAGVVNVLVNGRAGSESVRTTLQQPWAPQGTVPGATFAFSFSATGQTVTITGTGGAGQGATVVINRVAYAVPVGASDTPSSIAAALAAAITAAGPAAASAAGAVVTITWARSLACAATVTAIAVRPIRQQSKGFVVDVMAPGYALRDGVAALIDGALSASPRIALADGTAALVRFTGSMTFHPAEKERVFRRSLTWAVEFQTTQTETETTTAGLQTNVGIYSPASATAQLGQMQP